LKLHEKVQDDQVVGPGCKADLCGQRGKVLRLKRVRPGSQLKSQSGRRSQPQAWRSSRNSIHRIKRHRISRWNLHVNRFCVWEPRFLTQRS